MSVVVQHEYLMLTKKWHFLKVNLVVVFFFLVIVLFNFASGSFFLDLIVISGNKTS